MLSPAKEKGESVLVGASHPGRHVFTSNNALRYFNQHTILKKELELGEEDKFYLEEKNLCYAAEKILDMKCVKLEQCLLRGCAEGKRVAETANINETRRQNQLANCLQHSTSLIDSQSDDSVILSLPSTPVKQMPTPGESRGNSTPQLVHNRDAGDSQPHMDLSSLLWLMSVAPEPAASHCKRLMDSDQLSWKVGLYDVLMVFLNWGATLKSLGLEDVFDSSCTIFSPEMPSPFSEEVVPKDNFPSRRNVNLVLSAVSERLPPAAAMPLYERTLLLQLLVHGATDRLQRRSLYHWTRCVQEVVDSFDDWSQEKAVQIVSQLRLASLGSENAVFLTCSVFHLGSSRLNTLGLCAGHNVLAQLFEFPPDVSLSSVANSLQPLSQLLERFQLDDVFCITSLVHTLLIRHMKRIKTPSQEVIYRIHQWTMELRDSLKRFPFMFNLPSGALRERLSRLTSECRSVGQQTHFNHAFSSVENSPSKEHVQPDERCAAGEAVTSRRVGGT